jgi:DNA-binding phage protein
MNPIPAPFSELDIIRGYIRQHGPTVVARQSKVSRRALQHILHGTVLPKYSTMQTIMAAMARAAS